MSWLRLKLRSNILPKMNLSKDNHTAEMPELRDEMGKTIEGNKT